MNAPIMLSIKYFLAVSPEMSGYIHEQTRGKRIPVDTEATASTTELGATEQATTAVGNSYKLYYAISSGRAPVAINDKVCIQCLLDDGSELNIMSEDLYNELGHPIDRNICRRINEFDSRIEQELDERYGLDGRGSVLEVLCNVIVDIRGVEIKQHICVVKYLPSKLIHGHPWRRITRAVFSNEDDGSYTVTIRSPDDMKQVKFLVIMLRVWSISYCEMGEECRTILDVKELRGNRDLFATLNFRPIFNVRSSRS